MTEAGDHEPLLRFAEKYIARRTHVGAAVEELKRQPELFKHLVGEFDLAIVKLNDFVADAKQFEAQEERLPNAVAVGRGLSEQKLPTLVELERETSKDSIGAGIRAFRTAEALMRAGEVYREAKEKSEMPDASAARWEFHQDIRDPGQLAASLMLEIYGKYVEQRFPKVADFRQGGFTVVLALEEMLVDAAIRGQRARLFEAIKGWVSVDEGFSQQLVGEAQKLEAHAGV